MMDWLKKIKAIIDNMEDYKAQAQVNRNVLDDPRLTDWWDGAYHTTRDWLKDVQQLYINVAEVTPTGYDVYCSQDAPTFATWERVAWLLYKPDTFTVSEIDTRTFGSDTRGWPADNEKLGCIDIIEAGTPARWKKGEPRSSHVVRSYRILPAGSPPPGNEVSE